MQSLLANSERCVTAAASVAPAAIPAGCDGGCFRRPTQSVRGTERRRGGVRSAFVLALAMALAMAVGPVSAAASTLSSSVSGPFLHVTYQAAPGEINNVSVSYKPFGTPKSFTISDTGPGVVIGAPAGCTPANNGSSTTCAFGLDVFELIIQLEDQDDRASLLGLDLATGSQDECPTALAVKIQGGSGNDRLEGSPTCESLEGEQGADTLIGNGGHDSLTGGPGMDALDGGGGDDTLDGGRGVDTMNGGSHGGRGDMTIYQTRIAPVTVDLRVSGGQGEAGENDTITGIEGARTGAGNDTLIGDSGPNFLQGGFGDDTVIGGRGNDLLAGSRGDDTLTGGRGKDDLEGGRGNDILKGGAGDDHLKGDYGTDRLFGGAGNDEITARDYWLKKSLRDQVSCGTGKDTAHLGDIREKDSFRGDCERVDLTEGLSISVRRARTRRRRVLYVALRLRCPAGAKRCKRKLTAYEKRGQRRGKSFTKRFSIRPGKRRVVKIRFRRARQRLVFRVA